MSHWYMNHNHHLFSHISCLQVKKGKIYTIELTLLQGSVQKKIVFNFFLKKFHMICNKKYFSTMIAEPSHA